MSPVSTDERLRPCPHCNGSGKVLVPAGPSYSPGEKLWWRGGGYGYDKRIPVECVSQAPSGITYRIKGITADGTREFHSTVRGTSLEIRFCD